MQSFQAAPTGRSGSMAALMVIIIINFIVPANNTQKTLEIVLTPVMTSKKQVIATTDSNCWQVPCTLATGVKVLWRTTAGRSSPVMTVKKQVIATTDSWLSTGSDYPSNWSRGFMENHGREI